MEVKYVYEMRMSGKKVLSISQTIPPYSATKQTKIDALKSTKSTYSSHLFLDSVCNNTKWKRANYC
jgi:hypothetical protein